MKGINGLNTMMMMGMMIIAILLGSCSSQSLVKVSETPSHLAATAPTQKSSLTPTHAYTNTSLWAGDTASIWNQLQPMSKRKLAAMKVSEHDLTALAWIELALLSKETKMSTKQFASKLMAWNERFKTHPANQLLPDLATLKQLQADKPPKKIALLLPQSGRFKASGQMLYEGFINAYYADLNKGLVQQIKFYDTSLSKNITQLYKEALAWGADVIVGPLLKEHVLELSHLASNQTKTLALNYSDVAENKLPRHFYEFGLLPEDETLQMATHARESKLSHAIIIAPENLWGKRLVSAFSKTWQAKGGNIAETWYYTPHANFAKDIAHLLNINPVNKKIMQEEKNPSLPERRQDFDVIFLFAKPKEARIIVPLLRYFYTGKTPIYADSSSYTRPINKKERDLDGVIICDIPWQMQVDIAKANIPTDRLYAVGEDAYLLSHSLSRLTYLPNFPMYGNTGALSLSLNHQVHRQLPCATIRHG